MLPLKVSPIFCELSLLRKTLTGFSLTTVAVYHDLWPNVMLRVVNAGLLEDPTRATIEIKWSATSCCVRVGLRADEAAKLGFHMPFNHEKGS